MELEELLLLRVGNATPEEDEPPSAELEVLATILGQHIGNTNTNIPATLQWKASRGEPTPPLKTQTSKSDNSTSRNATTKQLVKSMQPCSA